MSGEDDDLSRARTELGEPDSLYSVSPRWVRTKLLLAAGLLLYGVVANYLWWVHGPQNFHHAVFHLLIWPPAVGLVLLWHMHRNRGLCVLLYPTGLLRLRGNEVDSFPWAEIDVLKLRVKRATEPQFERGPDGEPTACWFVSEVPLVQLWNAGFTVNRTDGKDAHLSPVLADYPALCTEVQRRTFAQLWPTIWSRFQSGEVVEFGAIEVAPTGLRHAKKFLPWREFKELAISQGRLTVKQTSRWLPWAVVDMGSFPNPHIFFALVEEARRFRLPPKEQPQPRDGNQHND